MQQSPSAFSLQSSELPWLLPLGDTPMVLYAGREVKPFNFKKMPKVLQQRIYKEWMTFSDQMTMMTVDKQLNNAMGNLPVFGWTLIKSGLGLPYPCFHPEATLSALVSDAIRSGDGVCMAHMADNLDLNDRHKLVMFSLLTGALAPSTHPRQSEAEHIVYKNLWRKQLIGQPPTALSDMQLWNVYKTTAGAQGNMPIDERATRVFQLMQRAVFGFCDRVEVLNLRRIALKMSAENSHPQLNESHRNILIVMSDLLNFFAAPDRATSNAAWMIWHAHLHCPQGQKVLKILNLWEFAILLDQHEALGHASSGVLDATIANNLKNLYEAPLHFPHIPALAGMTLAAMIHLKRSDIMSNASACDLLQSLISNEGLRENLRIHAKLVLAAIQLQNAHLLSPRTLLDLAVFAGKCLRSNDVQLEHGLGIDKKKFANDVLLQLKALGVPTTEAHALEAWHFSPPASIQRVNAGLQVAKFYLESGRQLNSSEVQKALTCLKENLYFSPETLETKLLLSRLILETSFHNYSEEDAVKFCRSVYASEEASTELKGQAIALLSRVPASRRRQYQQDNINL